MIFIDYTQNYQDQVVDLLNLCFPNKRITAESFLWKHYDAYFEQKTVSMLAKNGNIVCAYVCFTPLLIRAGDGQVRQFFSCAVQATHPEYRRQGLVTRLTQLIEKKLGEKAEYIGFSNASGVQIDRFSKTINYQIVGQWQTKIMPCLPYRSKYSLRQVERLKPVSSDTSLFGIEKNFVYLDWRYQRYPKIKYLFFQIEHGQKSVGYIVARLSRWGFHIIDIICQDMTPASIKEIMRACTKQALVQVKIWLKFTYLPNSFWQKALPVGLSRQAEVFLTLKTADQSLVDPEKWWLCDGDVQ